MFPGLTWGGGGERAGVMNGVMMLNRLQRLLLIPES